MILDDLSFKKIEERLYELDKKIDAIKEFEKEKKDLLKFQLILEQYRILKLKSQGRLATAQLQKNLNWYSRFPYLALHKGEEMCQREICRYTNEKNEDTYHGKQAKELRATGTEKQIDDYLRQFCDDTPKMPKAPQVGVVEGEE